MSEVKVNSSNVASVDYDKAAQTLKVTFHSGASYTYGSVSPQTYAALLRAESVGSYVHRVLRKGHPVVAIDAAAPAPPAKRR